MKKVIFVILVICFSHYTGKGQAISNVVARQDGDKVIITYNLQCESDAEISVFLSETSDGPFIGPLKSLTGDVGIGITAGSKTIIWKTLQDNDMLIGDNILFRVTGIPRFDKFTDIRDRKIYKTVKIGSQIWMAVNLCYKEINGCLPFHNKESNVAGYGYLYDWEAAKNSCPTGWHLPSDAEWRTLIDFLGGDSIAGGKLKEAGTENWKKPNTGATNESGFTAMPGGARYMGYFFYYGSDGTWWTSTEANPTNAWNYVAYSKGCDINRRFWDKKQMISVRCIKNK